MVAHRRRTELLFAYHIGAEILLSAGILPIDHHRLLNCRMLRQVRLYLPQFHAEAADLDLVILAPEELHHAGGQHAAQIAGPIHTFVGTR